MFNFLRNCLWSHFIFCIFPKGLHNFSIPPAIHGLPPHSRQHLSLFVFFFKPLEWDKGVFYFDFDLHFIMTNDLSIIPCIYWPFLYPFCFWEKGHLRKMSIQILCPFVIGFSGFFFFFFFFELEEFFIFSKYKSFTGYIICKYFSSSLKLPFHFLDGILWSTKVLNFDEIYLPIFLLSLVFLLLYLIRLCLTQDHKYLLLYFLPRVSLF